GARLLPGHRHPAQVLGAARASRHPPRVGGLRSGPATGGVTMALTIAFLIFIAIVVRILRAETERSEGTLGDLLGSTGLMGRLSDLGTQAGYKGTPSDLVLIILA